METRLIIYLTITTGLRPDLFVRTIKSIRENVTDIHLVNKWIVVDDNTELMDHARMKRALHGLNVEWIWKRPTERGHARSMNILQQRVPKNVTHVFHWEDDWQVVVPSNYIERMLYVLNDPAYASVGQVLLNENYRERDVDPRGTITKLQHALDDAHVLVHTYDPMTRVFGNAYWPHYSLRPSLMRADVWPTVGTFHEQHENFEREYAERYYFLHGYETAFLRGVNAHHLGKLTWQDDREVASAYALNNVGRY